MKLNFRSGSAYASQKAKAYIESINPEDVNNIMIIRHAAIGDLFAMRPFLVEARKFFPNAKITLNILRTYSYGVPYDLIDDLLIIENKDKKLTLWERIKEARKIPAQDIVFDFTDSALTNILTLFTKSKLKIGYPYRIHRRLFYNMTVHRSDFVLETESMIHMLNFLGAKHSVPFFDYGFNMQKSIQDKPYIIYFAGASTKDKCWEEDKFSGLIIEMTMQYTNYHHVILEGIKDDEKFENIYNTTKHMPNVVKQKAMPLNETMDYLNNASIVVCNDTGIRNMAIAVNTPTVGIFNVTGPYRYWPRNGIHEIVFNPNFTSPSINDARNCCEKILKRTI